MAKKKQAPDQAPVVPEETKFEAPENDGITILSGSIKRSQFCHFNYAHQRANAAVYSHSVKGGYIVHNDLKEAFKRLNQHLPAICEELELEHTAHDDYDPAVHTESSLEYKLSMYRVKGFSIVGEDDDEGFILTGEKQLSTGETVTLQTPRITEKYDYGHFMDLVEAIRDCQDEVFNYLHGKQAPVMVQQEMAFPENLDGENAPYAETEL